MGEYAASIKVDEEELDQIFRDLNAARETIWRCYTKLETLGIVEIKRKEAASGN